MKTNSHNKTLSILLTLVTTLAVVNTTLLPYFGNNKLMRLFEGLLWRKCLPLPMLLRLIR